MDSRKDMRPMATLELATEKTLVRTVGEVEFGSFASPANTETVRNTLVIASYNIRYAVGSFLITGSIGRRVRLSRHKRRPRLVAHHLQKAATALSDGVRLPTPEILALQEADKETTRAGRHDIARELAQKLRMNYALASADTPQSEVPKSQQWYLDFEEHLQPSDGGKTGVAILSRLPFAKIERIDLPWTDCPWRPRLALAATIQNGERKLHIFNSHIDPHAEISEQLEQHEAVLSRAEGLTDPVILLGDFNTLSKRSGLAMRALLESKGFRTPFRTGTATWRAGLIRLHTDWIFVRGAKVKRFGVARGLRVSDHWPVWVEVDLAEEAGRSA